MKISKRILGLVTVFLVAVLLIACNKPEEDRNIPTFTGVGAVSIEVGTAFNPLAGVGATDHDGKDLTADIVVTENTVNINVAGSYSVKYSVTDEEDLTATATRAVTVTEDVDTTLYANGQYNFRFEGSPLRHTFFAAAEGYLLDNVAGGVPLFVNSGASLYSSRVSLPVENYVPVMGWGSAFGTLTDDDFGLTFSGGKVGVAGEHTYRGAFNINPTTFNQWISDDSVSSDAQAFMLDSLYKFVFNETNTAYEVIPSMAHDNPEPLEPEQQGAYTVSTKWSVPIKADLEWGFHPLTNTTGLETDIDATTFVDTFRFALEQGWFRAISGGGHFWASSNVVVGAQAFRNFIVTNPTATQAQKDTEWAKVGIKVVDNSIEFEFASPLSEWNVKYWLSSTTMSPIHLGLLAREGVGVNNYARTPEQMAYTGAYYLDNYEQDKVLEYKKNPNYHNPNLYNYDGYYFVIIERAEIIFAEFEAGNLDAAGLPLTKYEQYKNDNRLKRSPGATTFRMSINGLGTVANQQAQFPSGPGNTWVPEILLSNLNMKKALYWVVDRETLAWDILKTSDPGQFYFSDAYLVDPQSGTAFRHTPQGIALGSDLSTGTYGYNLATAQAYFDLAISELIAEGKLTAGTAANPRVIELDLSIQAASTSQAQLAEFLKNSIQSAFNGRQHHIELKITIDQVTFPDNYYQRTIVGRFDLGTGGISGSTLDAASFLDVFTSDNRGGFTLDWGFDTSIANIPVSYEYDGEQIVNEYWSFDAIVAALNGPVTVVNGREALDTDAINNVISLITALPEVADYVHATHAAAVLEASNAYGALLPGAQNQVTNVAKLNSLVAARTTATNAALVKAVNDAIIALDLDSTDAQVTEALKLYEALSAANKGSVTMDNKVTLALLFAPQVTTAINAIPDPFTLDAADVKKLTDATALYTSLVNLIGANSAELLLTEEIAEVIAETQAERKILVAIKAINDLITGEDALTVAGIKLTDRYAIADVRAIYNAAVIVNNVQIQDLVDRVTNRADLFALEAAVKPLVDREEAFLWTLGLATLPEPHNITADYRVQVETVIRGFNSLSNEAKLLFVAADDDYPAINMPAGLETLQDIIEVLEVTVADLLELVLPTVTP